MRHFVILFFAIALVLAVAVEGQRFRQVCEPNSYFKRGCNNCRCNSAGTDMACTKKACAPNHRGYGGYGGYYEHMRSDNQQQKKVCEPGSYFKMDCNDCRCNDDGTNAACTLKACLQR